MEIYLDNAATTRVNDRVREEIGILLKEEYGNPSSIHGRGVRSDAILRRSRAAIGKSIGATEDEIIFNSCATEGNNQILNAYRKGHIISDAGEHPSVYRVLKHLEEEGTEVTFLKLDSKGRIDPEELRSSIRKDTALVSMMMVNNETGCINPVDKVYSMIKEAGSRAKFHVDMVQGYLKLPVDVNRLGIDFATMSLHKIHGPKGIGAMYIRKGLKPESLLRGGGQEHGFRAGTHNVPYIGAAALIPEIYVPKMEENYRRMETLRKKLLDYFRTVDSFVYHGDEEGFSPYIMNISFKGAPSQVMLNLLSAEGVYVSTGSACSQKNMKDSHVLTAMGLKKDEISSSLRISFSDDTTEEEIDKAIEIFRRSLGFFRKGH